MIQALKSVKMAVVLMRICFKYLCFLGIYAYVASSQYRMAFLKFVYLSVYLFLIQHTFLVSVTSLKVVTCKKYCEP